MKEKPASHRAFEPTPESKVDTSKKTVVMSDPEGNNSEFGSSRKLTNDYERYRDFNVVGHGGVGTVNSCTDSHLGRKVALKVLNARYRRNREQRTRFVREARVISQLEHPNIVPVHELGTGDDGNVYFTMKLLEGITLRDVINGLIQKDEAIVKEYTLDRLLDMFVHVCNAISFAHSRGVLHRDLKPDNIQLGSFGEVLVLDWGLAKIIDDDARDDLDSDVEIQEILGAETGDVTMDGSISGTPLYMAPEQALGRNSELDERTDEYSLGVILYEILTLRRPVDGGSIKEILEKIVHGRIHPPRRVDPSRRIPREMEAICMKALSRRRSDRYPNVPSMVRDIENYQQGRAVSAAPDSIIGQSWKWCKRHALLSSTFTAAVLAIAAAFGTVALIRYTRFQSLIELADKERVKGNRIHEQRDEASKKLLAIRTSRLERTKTPEEVELEREVQRLHSLTENQYDLALRLYDMSMPMTLDHSIQRAAYSEIYGNRMLYAVQTSNYDELRKLLDLARKWIGPSFEQATPEMRAKLEAFQKLAQGDAYLWIESRPEGARITIAEIMPDVRNVLVPTNERFIGVTPINKIKLAPGSYQFRLQIGDRPDVLATVLLDHSARKHMRVTIPRTVPDGMVYIPAGDFMMGGTHARRFRLHRRSVDPYFIKKYEVTYEEYLKFWFDKEGAARNPDDVSRIRIVPNGKELIAWDKDGKLIPLLKPYMPIVGISQASADRYCRWLSLKSGRIYRLPTDEEWEKAARGSDGREFVWGNHYNPDFAFTYENKPAQDAATFWAPPGSFPMDRSIYGVMDMGGNVREWTSTKFEADSPFYQIRGASSSVTMRFLHCAYASDTPVVPSDVGFRYVTPLKESDF